MSQLGDIQAYVEQLSPAEGIDWREWFVRYCLDRWRSSGDDWPPDTHDDSQTASAHFRRGVELLSSEDHWELQDWYVAREDLLWDAALHADETPSGVADMAARALADFMEGRCLVRRGRIALPPTASGQSPDATILEREPTQPSPPRKFGSHSFVFTPGFWPSAEDRAPVDYFTAARFVHLGLGEQWVREHQRPAPKRAGDLWTLNVGYLHRAIATENQNYLVWFWVCNLNEYFGFSVPTNS